MASPIDPHSDRPLYKQLADILRDKILSGEWQPGTALPSKAQLTEQYGVSVNTVEGALRELKAAGMIAMERGRHSRVLPVRVDVQARYRQGKKGYAPDVESAFAREHGVPWSSFGPELERRYVTIPAPRFVADLLRRPAGDPVVERTWIHRIEGAAVRLAKSYLYEDMYGDTILCDPNEPPWPGGTIAQLRHIGKDITAHRIGVRWREPNDEERALFNGAADKGVLEQWRVHLHNHRSTTTPDGVPVEAAMHVWPASSGRWLWFTADLQEHWAPPEA